MGILLLSFSISFKVGKIVFASNNNVKVKEIKKKVKVNVINDFENINTKIVDNNPKEKLYKQEKTSIIENNDGSNNNIIKNESNKKDNENPEIVEESTVIKEKYGVKFLEVKSYEVTYNNDGSFVKKLKTIYNKMDTSLYNANTTILKEEAIDLVATNWNQYNEVLNYVNMYRLELNISTIALDYDLCIAATIRSLEMAYTNNTSHIRPGNKSFYTVLSELGYKGQTMGENIASGYSTPKAVTDGWRKSDGHYQNMINTDFNKIGIGMVKLDGTKYGIYWTQIFTG